MVKMVLTGSMRKIYNINALEKEKILKKEKYKSERKTVKKTLWR